MFVFLGQFFKKGGKKSTTLFKNAFKIAFCICLHFFLIYSLNPAVYLSVIFFRYNISRQKKSIFADQAERTWVRMPISLMFQLCFLGHFCNLYQFTCLCLHMEHWPWLFVIDVSYSLCSFLFSPLISMVIPTGGFLPL